MSGLKELLGEELYSQVAEKLGDKEVAVVNDGSWIPKPKFDALNEQVKDLKTQLSERDDQLKELGKAAKDNEELTTRITELEAANEKQTTEYAAALRQKSIDYAIETALIAAKAFDPKTVVPLIDLSRITVADDGTVSGVDEQVKALGEAKGFLFDASQEGSPQGGNGSTKFVGQKSAEQGKGSAGVNPWKADTLNLTEQSRIYRENPELAKQLMEQAKA